MKKAFSILGMIILLAGSVFLDQLFYQLEKFTPDFQPGIPFWTELPVYIVFAGLSLVLAWFVLAASQRSFWVAFFFISAGLSGLLLMTKFGVFEIWPWIEKPSDMFITSLSNTIASSLGLSRHIAALILVTGLARLLPDRFLQHRSN